ncbi:MAG: hypothetical protein ACRDC4_06930 [Plesiomonas sp.]
MSLLEFCITDRQREVIALCEKMTIEKAAKELGIAERNVYAMLKRVKGLAAKRGHSPEHDMTKTVPEGFAIRGTSTLYGKDGNAKLQWVKTKVDAEAQLAMMREVVEAMAEDVVRAEPMDAPEHTDSDLMAVYPIGDAHIGQLSWGRESGDDWDLHIAEQTLCGAFVRCVNTAPACDEAVIINLGDFYHRENMEGTTQRSGHALDTDGRFQKMAAVGVKIMRYMITAALERHKSVRVINVRGNHDDTVSVMLSVCLANQYENEPRVTIDDSPSVFNYVEFGKVLIGAHHGHTAKAEKLAGVMAADMPEAWGRTKHRTWMTGHIHHASTKEYPGVYVESFATLAAKDAYAASGGWRSRRNTQCIVFHREFGEVERHTIDISMV